MTKKLEPPPPDFDENPEWTEENFARARPFKEVFPRQYKAWKKMGRPPVESPKIHIGFRLAADVVKGIRATGRGYNARVEKVLREALAKGKL
ncbi:MAG: BrnA antitoxin family protein [Acetobacteraceae bacterium]|nr:BrnA antitoxin family protein [Acetobacteraceae bacterium]